MADTSVVTGKNCLHCFTLRSCPAAQTRIVGKAAEMPEKLPVPVLMTILHHYQQLQINIYDGILKTRGWKAVWEFVSSRAQD